jgi:DNA mismatch endonuclease, patch repair protein
MVDMFSRQQRSEIMSKVKGSGNRATELRLIAIFREYKIRGWRRRKAVFGKPDFIFPASRLAIFVDGCFWHGCPTHGSIPVSNRLFWLRKIKRNCDRDRLVNRELRKTGWRVLRIWQHDLRKPALVARRIGRSLSRIALQ